MGLFTKDIGTMDDLLLHGLKDIYYAENQIVKSLPKLIDKATNRSCRKASRTISRRRRTRSSGSTRFFRSSGRSLKACSAPRSTA